jgi:hypothetical protein
MTGQLLVFVSSLAGVAVLILISGALGLGRDAQIAGESEARELADNAICGFQAREVVIDVAGHGALLEDAEAHIMLLAPHGAHFAARLLNQRARVTREETRLTIDGTALELGEAAGAWEKRIKALDS